MPSILSKFAGAGLGHRERRSDMNISTLLKPHSESWEKHQFAATLLDLMFTTLKESSSIVLFLDWPSAYGLKPSNSEAHWRSQNEILVKLLETVLQSSAVLDLDLYFELLNILSEYLTNELKFQATFLVEVRQFLEGHGPNGDVYSDAVDLLEYLLNTQASLSQRMLWLIKEYRDFESEGPVLSKVDANKVDENEIVESVAA